MMIPIFSLSLSLSLSYPFLHTQSHPIPHTFSLSLGVGVGVAAGAQRARAASIVRTPFDNTKNSFELTHGLSVISKKSPNVYKSCPKIISLEKLKILTPLRKLRKNVGDLGKLIVAKWFNKLPKVQLIAPSGHTAHGKDLQQEAQSRVCSDVAKRD